MRASGSVRFAGVIPWPPAIPVSGGAVDMPIVAAPPIFQIVRLTKAHCPIFARQRPVETGHSVGAREDARNTHRRDEAFVRPSRAFGSAACRPSSIPVAAGIEKAIIRGNPDENEISTSYVERFNLSTRMASRRFTRLTNGFSKKLGNHSAAIALWIGFYNFCRIHELLRCTPAMALGVADHVWSVAELMQAALEPSGGVPPPIPRTPPTTLRPGTRQFRLIVGRGGKGTNKPRI